MGLIAYISLWLSPIWFFYNVFKLVKVQLVINRSVDPFEKLAAIQQRHTRIVLVVLSFIATFLFIYLITGMAQIEC